MDDQRPSLKRTPAAEGCRTLGADGFALPPLPLRSASLDWSRTYVVGVLNVTPDSFFDGGRYADLEAAVEQGRSLAAHGADIIDVGGESTRPGSAPVTVEEELRRVLPVIARLAAEIPVPLSIDTTKAAVAAAALDAGAEIVNDVSGGRLDPAMFGVAGRARAAMVLGHLRGRPATMQEDIAFRDVAREVTAELCESAAECVKHGAYAIVDPGLGFGKTAAHNLELIRGLGALRDGCRRPVCVGPSRKAFLGVLTGLAVEERLLATCAAVTACVLGGADLVRVHDVEALAPALRVADAVRRGLGERAGMGAVP
jgi:dihydropteroate synthase